jgi:CubicO group peptidase (beta-lactamase class C family)
MRSASDLRQRWWERLSSITRAGMWSIGSGSALDVTLPPARLIGLFSDRSTYFPPGTRVQYGNSAYALLGYIIERTAGDTYAHFLRSQILEPLSMFETGYDPGDGRRVEPVRGRRDVLQHHGPVPLEPVPPERHTINRDRQHACANVCAASRTIPRRSRIQVGVLRHLFVWSDRKQGILP